MADWTTLPNAAVGVGGLPSGTTVTALRDNPVAIAGGASGAPRNLHRSIPLGYLPNISFTLTPAGYDDLDPLTSLDINVFATLTGTSQNLQIRSSANNGGTWGSWVTLQLFADGQARAYHGGFNLVTGVLNVSGLGPSLTPPVFSLNLNTGVTNVNAFQFRFSGGDGSGLANGRVLSRGNTE